MISRKIIANFVEEGWVFVHIRGGHRHYNHPDKPGRFTLPEAQRNLPTGTVRNINPAGGQAVGRGRTTEEEMRYPIVIHKDPDSDYGVTVPDVPGCFSAGETLDEALSEAVEAIECHLEGLLMDGEPVPVPQTMEHHRGNPDYRDGVWAWAEIDIAGLSRKWTQN